MSPILSFIFLDDLIDELRSSGYGVHIGRAYAGRVLYADDILLLSTSCYGLQAMLNVCAEFGKNGI